MDLFSRWIECTLIRKTNAQTIRKELSELVFLRFGASEVSHSDNGTEFKNKALNNFLEERGVTHTTIPLYYSRANPVERVNRTIKTMITSYLENNHRDSDLHVPELTYAYNTSVQVSTGWSPAFLNLGRQPASPLSLRRREERAAEEHAESADIENWRTRILVLPDVQQIAADNASKAQKRQARYYNASRRAVRYNLGDKVRKRNCVLSSALQGVTAELPPPKFAGAYMIAAQLGPNMYEVIDQDGKSVGKFHVEDLKPFHWRSASEENSEGEQAEASPSEISEERNASFTSHSANAEAPEAEVHPRKWGRPRKARLVVKRTPRFLDRRVNKRTLVADGADERPTQPSTSDAAPPLPRPRRRPAGSKNTYLEIRTGRKTIAVT